VNGTDKSWDTSTAFSDFTAACCACTHAAVKSVGSACSAATMRRSRRANSNQRDVWSALRSQLIEHYTGDAEASGYGIYLVFWFGDGKLQAPPHGVRPATPAEMERRLTETLLAEETGKIAVMVIDMSQPV